MNFSVPIVIEEASGKSRFNEPVTVGIPFPRGSLINTTELKLYNRAKRHLPLQSQVLATWPDGSAKWVLLDFQVSAQPNTCEVLELCTNPSPLMSKGLKRKEGKITIDRDLNSFTINTGAASFFLNTIIFKPFDRVVITDHDFLDNANSEIVLVDEADIKYEPKIDNITIETRGDLRATVKIEGQFINANRSVFAHFVSRVSFFVNSAIVKIEFTIHNPRAAKHPGGLWDLGDPSSIFFKDLSIYTGLNSHYQPHSTYHLCDEIPVNGNQPSNELSAKCHKANPANNFIIYQDSSGGENWKSRNHVNRNGEVRNSFRGYRVFCNNELIREGFRTNPTLSIHDNIRQITASVQEFWQNFPKALETHENALIIRLFPKQYNDLFELQGGEQKTHTLFVSFGEVKDESIELPWSQNPLYIRSRLEWYAKTDVFGSLSNVDGDKIEKLCDAVLPAIKGEDTFFDRREITDEYGWRHFGDLYADHEAVGHKGSSPLISHYNNQYDGIYGMLTQFLIHGDTLWFVLANQLCSHVKDIDIYHTDYDRPEYNRGLFWHTDHYKDAQTSTHRCFSQKNADSRNRAAYGGGPSLSHNYSTGLLLHHYLTGSSSSLDAVKDLAVFVENNLYCEETVANRVIKNTKRMISCVKGPLQKRQLVQINQVYGLDGPGRASGNSLNTLLDAYSITDDTKYLKDAESLIQNCINPDDDIEKRHLLDAENRWMYLVFLQSLGKYLDLKSLHGYFDTMWLYARHSLITYAEWMVNNEYFYLDKPEKLEYPNETWAAQEIRKSNVLLYAAKYSNAERQKLFLDKARYFYEGGMKIIDKFETKTLTRPIVLLMLNGMMLYSFKDCEGNNRENTKISPHLLKEKYKDRFCLDIISSVMKTFVTFSIKREFQFLKWRLLTK